MPIYTAPRRLTWHAPKLEAPLFVCRIGSDLDRAVDKKGWRILKEGESGTVVALVHDNLTGLRHRCVAV